MIDYNECKKIAMEKAKEYGLTVDKAYSLHDSFVFDTDKDCVGIFPVVVDSNGECSTLWGYLNKFDLSMNDMVEREL